MPRIAAFYLRHVAIGFLAAAVFVALLLWTDVAGLRGLVLRSPDGPLAVTLLLVFNGLVFGGAQAAMAVFLMAEDEDGDEPPAGRREPAATLVEVASRVPSVRA